MDLSHYNQINLFGADMIYQDFLDPNELCATIQKEITPLIKDTDFEGMYKGGGRPPISPKVLLLTTVMQYLERLPDRIAATNLKYRLDWKIAFGLPLEFEGINHTTLVYFRNRLIENEQASYAFDKILEHLSNIGLIKKKKKMRIDSTHVVGNVRELSRLELFHETLRLFCKDIAGYKDEMDANLVRYHELYVEKVPTRGITDVQKNNFIEDAGIAMRGFIDWGVKPLIRSFECYDTLKKVFEQNFTDENPDPDPPPKLIKIATGKDHICSPHETDARYSNKGGKGWLGYKVQVVETINVNGAEEPNFITHISINEATDHDGDSVIPIIEELKDKYIKPNEVYGDTHYNTKKNIEELDKNDIHLKGPVAPKPNKKTLEKNKGFKFIKEETKVICPTGIESKRCGYRKNNVISASFPQHECSSCNRKPICMPEKRGKCIQQRVESDLLTKRRKLMETEEFKEDMHRRNGIEGTISGLVRGQGMRRSRFKNKDKANLQMKFIGAAANVKRLHRKREIERKGLVKDMQEGFEAAMAAS